MILLAVLERSTNMPKLYRLVPVSVSAIQVDEESIDRAALWCGGVKSETDIAINIPTTRGVLRAGVGDYIFKETDASEFDVMTAKEFERKYKLI